MSELKTYQGQLSLQDYDEAWDILFLSTIDDPLAEQLEKDIGGKNVTARYWVTDKPCSKEEAAEDVAKQVLGKVDAKFGSHYSEYTGYLWTDEEVKIGGHDLIKELSGSAGKWLILEIEIHDPA